MRSRLFKSNIEAEIYGLKESLSLLQLVQQDTARIANQKAKDKKAAMDAVTVTGQLNEEDAGHHNAFINYAFHFQPVVIHSLVVSAFSLFEDWLYQVTRWLNEDPTTKKPLEERWGIRDYRRHLDKQSGLITANGLHPAWQKIIIFEKIRNLIVHHHNRFDTEDSKPVLIRLLKKYDVHLSRDHEFKIKDHRFLDDIVTALSTFAEDLGNEIYEKL